MFSDIYLAESWYSRWEEGGSAAGGAGAAAAPCMARDKRPRRRLRNNRYIFYYDVTKSKNHPICLQERARYLFNAKCGKIVLQFTYVKMCRICMRSHKEKLRIIFYNNVKWIGSTPVYLLFQVSITCFLVIFTVVLLTQYIFRHICKYSQLQSLNWFRCRVSFHFVLPEILFL